MLLYGQDSHLDDDKDIPDPSKELYTNKRLARWNTAEESLAFDEKCEATQAKTKGAYWCEGCYSWQLPAGHEEYLESCDCNY